VADGLVVFDGAKHFTGVTQIYLSRPGANTTSSRKLMDAGPANASAEQLTQSKGDCVYFSHPQRLAAEPMFSKIKLQHCAATNMASR
jgi:hypothetical protein